MRTMSIETITPEMAREWLDKTRDTKLNRNIRPANVSELASAVRSGEWDDRLGGTIIIGAYGVVIDGQHRLSAIVETGISMQFIVIVDTSLVSAIGLPLDIHARRSPADLLGTAPKVAQIIRLAASAGTGANRISVAELTRWEAIMGDAARDLMVAAPTAARGIATAGVKLAFCVFAVEHPGEQHRVFGDYRSLTLHMPSEASTHSMRILFRRITKTGTRTAGGTAQLELCYVTLAALDNPALGRTLLPKPSDGDSVGKQIRRAVSKRLKNLTHLP